MVVLSFLVARWYVYETQKQQQNNSNCCDRHNNQELCLIRTHFNAFDSPRQPPWVGTIVSAEEIKFSELLINLPQEQMGIEPSLSTIKPCTPDVQPGVNIDTWNYCRRWSLKLLSLEKWSLHTFFFFFHRDQSLSSPGRKKSLTSE